jgi:hypothetical protein
MPEILSDNGHSVDRLDSLKRIAFSVVKPLYCSLFHQLFSYLYLNFGSERIAAVRQGCRWLAGPTFNCG